MQAATRQQSDLQLVQAVLSGRAQALDEFVVRVHCIGPILNVQNSRLGAPLNQEDLADLAQDTLVVAWRKLATFAGQSSLETWLYKICSFELLSYLRRQGRRSEVTFGLAEVEEPPQDRAPSLNHSTLNEVGMALRHLASREAQVVRLKHFDELTFKEIGVALGLSLSTTKTHYYRGLAKLRSVLESRRKEVQP